MRHRFWISIALGFMALCAHGAELVIAQVAPFSGPLGANGTANYVGAKAYFDQVNAEGGIGGHTIRLVREDDRYLPDETVRLLKTVAQRDRPLAFINLLGSANVTAVLQDRTLEQLAVPAVGITPGADSLRNPGSPWMFHIHAGDNAQVRRMLAHLATVGVGKVAIAYQDIPFGKSGVAFADGIAPGLKLTITERVAVPLAAEDLKPAASQLARSGAQAYLMILAPNSGASLIRDVRQSGDGTPIYGMSYVPVKGIIDKSSLDAAVGVALAQITPNPSSSTSGLTRGFHDTMSRYAPPGTDHSQLHLVGYLAARVLVDALRRAGPAPTPERLAATLRRTRMDLGGYTIDFSGGNVGSQFVDIGVITRAGRLMY